MATSVTGYLGPMEVKPLSPARESAAPSAGKELSLTRLLAESVEAVGCSEKDAAISQGYEPNYWSRIKSGEKQAHLERVSRLPEPVQREMCARWGRQLGMHLTTEDTRRRVVANLVKAAAEALAEIA